ncbi:hypothetical protein V495_03084 [Pseudogymnoascus sp. VKM F-4514 (FW-929)]|nr:hypothetical protein V495_03084 [Pseudogymnoascus sp. VKM F-4514 (FW-929)]KFY56422.1 hypothetical protein V497_06282 [Pseudogymnoascus sp. VKM F-4516 (FW-969)]
MCSPTQAQLPGPMHYMPENATVNGLNQHGPYPLVEDFSKTRKSPACTLNQVIFTLGFSKNYGRIDTSKREAAVVAPLRLISEARSNFHCTGRTHRLGISSAI